MAEIIAKIDEVNSKSVNTSRGAGTVYEIKADGKRFSTFKAPLGKQAAELRGQTAKIEYSAVQKGEFTNYYLEGVEAAQMTAQQLAGLEAYAPGADGAVFKGNGVVHTISAKQDDKSAQINRSVAFKGAVDLVAAGVLSIDGIGDLDKLTTDLIPVVEGSYTGKQLEYALDVAAGPEEDLVKF